MSENIESTTTAPATETATESVTTTAPEATPEPVYNWSKLDQPEAAPEGSAETGETLPPAPIPAEPTAAEETETKPEQETQEDEELESAKELLTPEEQKEVKLPSGLRRKLRSLEKIESSVLNPLRDPSVPIAEAYEALAQWEPVRAQELATTLVTESAKNYPDQWLQTITGIEGVTKEQVLEWKEKASQVSTSTTDQPDYPSDIKETVEALTSTYDQDWRNPELDDYILDADKPLVKLARSAIVDYEARKADKQVVLDKLSEAEKRIQDLQPEIDQIKTAQETAFEQSIEQEYATAAKSYVQTVEKRSLDKFFADTQLAVSDTDAPDIKDFKGYIKSLFEPDGEYVSSFEMFALKDFSGAENLNKLIGRTDKYLKDAARKTKEAEREKDATKSAALKRDAETLRQNALAEQDRAVVMHQSAAREFYEKKLAPLMKMYARISDAERRLNANGRQEIFGETAPAMNGEAWKQNLVNSNEGNPFEGVFAKGLGSTGR